MSDRESPAADGMSRRAFGATIVGGALVVAARRAPQISLRERSSDVASAAPAPVPAPAPFELDEATVASLQDGMRSGQHTSRSLCEKYLARIASLDRTGPALSHVLETNPDALAIADALDAERKAKGVRGPLHGIPVLLKDNIATRDKMQTTAGSLALVGAKVPRDAFIAQRLRAAGAVLLGKTNLSEWANFRSTHSSSGWSGRGGQGKNPYALDRTPSGSSSGTGGAIAANYCAVGIGTETDGSITSPSSCEALVGIKPTLGLVSRSGIVPIAHSQDTAGPMCRSVADAAALLYAIAGADTFDAITAGSHGHVSDYAKALDPRGLKGARIGLPREKFFGYSTHTDALAEAAIRVLKDAGAILVDPANIDTAGKFDDSELEVLLYEYKADMASYLSELTNTSMKSLADLIAFNDAHASEEMPFFGQEIMIRAQKKGPLSEPSYRKALEKNHQMSRASGIDATMDKYKLDALVAPTQGPPSLIDLLNGDPGGGGSVTTPAAVAGYPHITVNMGFARGVPVGLSFFGRAWSEAKLIKYAFAYEQATKLRKPPTFAEHMA
ncbi:MAG: amidase [Gemmatimonadaceae bacterium]